MSTDQQVWVVYWDHWGESGITIEAVCATKELADEWISSPHAIKLDLKVEAHHVLTSRTLKAEA